MEAELQKQLNKLKSIQNSLLDFLYYDCNTEENYTQLISLLENHKIHDNRKEFIIFLSLLLQISIDHYRTNNFFTKIEKIISFFKNEIKNLFSDEELYRIFKKSKRILLYLIEEHFLIINKKISNKMKNYFPINNQSTSPYIGTYFQFFYPEINSFFEKDNRGNTYSNLKREMMNDKFKEKRRIGESDNYISELIRKDSIDDFISFVNKTNFDITKGFRFGDQSIYETNLLLMKLPLSFIEYAAFYGSTQIFKYLFKNGAQITQNIWKYAVHGNDSEIMHIIEENNIFPDDESFIESIKCHHIHITNYMIENYSKKLPISKCLRYFNFMCINDDDLNESFFYDFCKYNYLQFLEILLKKDQIDINQRTFKIKQIHCFHSCKYKMIFRKKNEKTSLIVAIEKRNIDIIQTLLKNENIDVNSKRISYVVDYNHAVFQPLPLIKEIKTALQIAIDKNDPYIVSLLLSNKNIDVNMKSKYYIEEIENSYEEKTALSYAIEKNNIEIIQLLLSHDSIDINNENKFVLNYNDRCDQFKWSWWVAKLKNEWTGWDDEEEFDQCFDEDEDEDEDNELKYKLIENHIKTPIHLAVEKNNIDVVKLLIFFHNLDINNKKKDFSIIKPVEKKRGYGYYYKYFKDIEKTALFIAVEKKYVEMVKLLQTVQIIDINIKCKVKKDLEVTALHKSANNQNTAIIELLMRDKTINFNSTDTNGRYPIEYAKNENIKNFFQSLELQKT